MYFSLEAISLLNSSFLFSANLQLGVFENEVSSLVTCLTVGQQSPLGIYQHIPEMKLWNFLP